MSLRWFPVKDDVQYEISCDRDCFTVRGRYYILAHAMPKLGAMTKLLVDCESLDARYNS